MNAYTGTLIARGSDGTPIVKSFPHGHARSAMGWPVVPSILYWGPRFYHERYGLPVMVTENGVAGLDWPEPERGAVFNDLGMLFEVAAAGLGVAVGTRRLSAAWTESGRLQTLFDVSAAAPFNYHAVVKPAQAEREVVADFVAWLKATFA